MRGIIGYIIFFSFGLLSAGAYFYQLHPEHSIEGDLPRLRKDVDRTLQRGQRLKDAWHESGQDSQQADTTERGSD